VAYNFDKKGSDRKLSETTPHPLLALCGAIKKSLFLLVQFALCHKVYRILHLMMGINSSCILFFKRKFVLLFMLIFVRY